MLLSKFYKQKIYPNLKYWETKFDALKYEKYALALPDQFSHSVIKDYKRIISIQEGEYQYDYFNFCYLNNILSLIINCLYHKEIPIIDVNLLRPDSIQWDWYFNQPFSISDFTSEKPASVCRYNTASFQPHFFDIYNPEKINLWGKVYKECLKLNQKTADYIQDEYLSILSPFNRVLGVICRGTDYTALHPPGHPIQPDTTEVIDFCKDHLKSSSYDAIYLATEERKIRDLFVKAFPGMILENKRKYYDDIYDNNESIKYIKDVHFRRDNDRYLSGLEYLSSITLLSHCTSLIGGNCTGTMGAVFMNNRKYEYIHIFNYGLYPYR